MPHAAARPRRSASSRRRTTVTDTAVVDVTSDRPAMRFTDSDGVAHEIHCTALVGADGSRSTRASVTGRKEYFRQYPFAWFGILCEAPPSAPELIYCRSDRRLAALTQGAEPVSGLSSPFSA